MPQWLKIFQPQRRLLRFDTPHTLVAVTALPSFLRHGPVEPASPILLSVPHAGRDYPLALRAALRVPLSALRVLEDRYADAIALGARREETMFVARRPRAWIDLNRSERDRDPMVEDRPPAAGTPMSPKVRGGLGLIPRRAGRADTIWRRRLSGEEVAMRIVRDHRPYHDAVAAALAAARARFGIAILIDVHSMPPLGAPDIAPRIVIGDRFGKSAGSVWTGLLEQVAHAHGIRAACNAPYAGGHILERHGNPSAGVHAIQLEFDRGLYLDGQLDQPGPGLGRAVALLRAMIGALADAAAPAVAAE